MKTLITLLLLSASVSYAGIERRFFDYKVTGATEAEVLAEAEAAIPQILSGKIRSVFQKECFPNNSRTIKVRNVTTSKVYAYVGGELVETYVAKVNYLHKRCRD